MHCLFPFDNFVRVSKIIFWLGVCIFLIDFSFFSSVFLCHNIEEFRWRMFFAGLEWLLINHYYFIFISWDTTGSTRPDLIPAYSEEFLNFVISVAVLNFFTCSAWLRSCRNEKLLIKVRWTLDFFGEYWGVLSKRLEIEPLVSDFSSYKYFLRGFSILISVLIFTGKIRFARV